MPELNADTRLLVVDDDAMIRRLLGRVLESVGLSCETAGTPAEARARFEELQPDLVLLDVNLPGESGISLAREFCAAPEPPAVVMVSGQDDAEVARIAMDAGAYGYITKPFKPNEVLIAARNALRRRLAERENRARRAQLEERIIERSAAVTDAMAQLRLAHEETILRLSKAIEYRDPETGGHIERMSHYCALMARSLDLDPDAIRVASRLHDIGKIAVPDAILRKPGPLAPDERATMERHAETGYRLLRGSNSELLDEAATIAWTHHERYDGAGYPRGLAGEDIPLAGRIAGVADVFDALTSDRPYRRAVPLDEAIAAMEDERGKHFDPVVLDAFLASIDEVKRIIARFDEEPVTPPPAEDEPAPGDGPVCTLQEAATALGITLSKMRRWADEGRIETVRTAGGHRRFPLAAVRRLAAQQRQQATVRPIAPPSAPVRPLADRLRADGAEMAAIAAASLYRGGPPGWFAAPEATPVINDWLDAMIKSCDSGDYAGALESSEILMRRAHLSAATLLERNRFIERFGEVAVRSLARSGIGNGELSATRRLVAAIQQAHLEGCA